MNRQEFKKLLQELSVDLSKSILDIKVDLANSRSLHTRIVNYVDESQALIEKIKNNDDGLEAILVNAKDLDAQISVLKANAESHLESINSSLGSIQAQVTEMEAAYQKFIVINEKINNEEDGLEAILDQSSSLLSDIEATKLTTETIYKEISKLKDTAAGYVNDLRNFSKSAKETLDKIERNHQDSEELKTKINNIFNISSQKAHANYFDKRQKTLAITSIAWLVGFLLMLALTVYFGDKYISPIVKIIDDQKKQVVSNIAIEALFVRLGLVSPVLLASLYCLSQFGNERRLHEQYAFKAVSMLSIESSVALLIRSLKSTAKGQDYDDQVTTFTIKTLQSIYKDPIEDNKRSLMLKGGNKLLELSVEMNESIGEIKNDLGKFVEDRSKRNP